MTQESVGKTLIAWAVSCHAENLITRELSQRPIAAEGE